MDLWLKIKVWTKIVVFALVISYIGCFWFLNYNLEVNIWLWFGHEFHPGVIPLVFYTLLAGIIGTLVFRMVFRTMLQLRQIYKNKAEAQLKTDVNDLKTKAAMLQTKPAPSPTAPSSTRP
jgi:hypothetical protein